MRKPTDTVFKGYADGIRYRLRDWHSNEFSWFFKDSWKLRPSLTVNYGIHYEYFGVPYEDRGLAAAPVGGPAGLCGISCGPLTTVEFVGKNCVFSVGRYRNNRAKNAGAIDQPLLAVVRVSIRIAHGNHVFLSAIHGDFVDFVLFLVADVQESPFVPNRTLREPESARDFRKLGLAVNQVPEFRTLRFQ